MTTTPILIPRSRLSSDPVLQHAQLRDYFCDKDAVARNSGDYWQLSLKWSDDPFRYVDPRLHEGLAWWGNDTKYHEMAMARKRKGRTLISLNDTWTLVSWSEWLYRRKSHHSKGVIVLHVDDHKDLASPRLFQNQEGWLDPITGQKVLLKQPETVIRAIASGALGMGSFLTPFLHQVPEADVRHLCQAPKCTDTNDYFIWPEWAADTLLSPSELRPTIRLEESCSRGDSGNYRFTNNLEEWLEGVSGSDKDLLLHIDMDYFCNRYDGDSDSIEEPKALDLSLEQVLEKIDELVNSLNKNNLVDQLADITISLSPGFFPAEFWALSSEHLLSRLGES